MEVLDLSVHRSTSEDGAKAEEETEFFRRTIENGLISFMYDLKVSAYQSRVGLGYDMDTTVECTDKVQGEMDAYAKALADASSNSDCRNCRGLVVSQAAVSGFEGIQRTVRAEGTNGCLIYSRDTGHPPRRSTISSWFSPSANQYTPTMRWYAETHQTGTGAGEETVQSLIVVSRKLKDLIESESIRSDDVHGPIKGFAALHGLSTYPVDQGVLDQLSSCHPVVVPESGGSTGVFTRRSTY